MVLEDMIGQVPIRFLVPNSCTNVQAVVDASSGVHLPFHITQGEKNNYRISFIVNNASVCSCARHHISYLTKTHASILLSASFDHSLLPLRHCSHFKLVLGFMHTDHMRMHSIRHNLPVHSSSLEALSIRHSRVTLLNHHTSPPPQ